jgi:hypothetical protein
MRSWPDPNEPVKQKECQIIDGLHKKPNGIAERFRRAEGLTLSLKYGESQSSPDDWPF